MGSDVDIDADDSPVASSCRGSVLLVACLAACVGTGCSTTATVVMRDGSRFEGRITASDAATITMRDPEYDIEREIQRSEITSIDHPGDSKIVTGVVLLGVGAFLGSVVFWGKDPGVNTLVALVLGIPLMAGGLFSIVYGYAIWRVSVDAAAPPEPPDVALAFAGSFEGTGWGGRIVLRW